MMSTEDTVRLSALLFESRQVCAEVVSASRGLDDRQLYEAAIGMQARLEAMFGAVSSGTRQTADNVRAFQDRPRSLCRRTQDGPGKAGRWDER